MTDQRRAGSGLYCTWTVAGDSLTGPWDISLATPFEAERALFAAPLVQQRSGQWSFVGFRNTEPEGVLQFDIIDPVAVAWSGAGLAASAADLEA